MKYVFICNGQKQDCTKTFCLYAGTGTCDHTTSEKYALNPPDKRRFEEKDNRYLWEVDDETRG